MNDKEITEIAVLLAKDRIHNFIVENLTANQIRELLGFPPIESQKNEVNRNVWVKHDVEMTETIKIGG